MDTISGSGRNYLRTYITRGSDSETSKMFEHRVACGTVCVLSKREREWEINRSACAEPSETIVRNVMRTFEMHLSRNNNNKMKVLTGENMYYGYRESRMNSIFIFFWVFSSSIAYYTGLFLCCFSKFQNKIQWVLN